MQLPEEILINIARHLYNDRQHGPYELKTLFRGPEEDGKKSVEALSLTCRHLRNLVMPLVFENVSIIPDEDTDTCNGQVIDLLRSPVKRHVKHLTVYTTEDYDFEGDGGPIVEEPLDRLAVLISAEAGGCPAGLAAFARLDLLSAFDAPPCYHLRLPRPRCLGACLDQNDASFGPGKDPVNSPSRPGLPAAPWKHSCRSGSRASAAFKKEANVS